LDQFENFFSQRFKLFLISLLSAEMILQKINVLRDAGQAMLIDIIHHDCFEAVLAENLLLLTFDWLYVNREAFGRPATPHNTIQFSPRAHMNFLLVCLITETSLSSSSNSLQLIVCSDENYSSRGPYYTPISFEFFDYFYNFNKLLGIPSDCLLKFDVTSM